MPPPSVSSGSSVWRLGHVAGPTDFVPRHLYSWGHRFDDPMRKYRTIYCASESMTCLKEVLADLRPNTKARDDFNSVFGSSSPWIIAGLVSAKYRASLCLVTAQVILDDGEICDITDASLRDEICDVHAKLLADHGMDYFDISEITSDTRIVSQTISRWLFDQGYAGASFPSKLDAKPCHALFEGHAHLEPGGTSIPLTDDFPELFQVCGEYRLVLKR